MRRLRARVRARVANATRDLARAVLGTIVVVALVREWPEETLAIIAACAFAVAGYGLARMAREGRAAPVDAPRARAPRRDSSGRVPAHVGPPGSTVDGVVYDERGKRQYAYTMGGWSWWDRDRVEWVKVGHSNAPALRVGQVQADNPGAEVRLLSYCDGGEPLERRLHAELADHRLDRSELFVPHADVLDVVRRIAADGQVTEAGRWVLSNLDPDDYRMVRRT